MTCVSSQVAIATKGKENIVFGVASLDLETRQSISYSKEELILKCSFNGKQCHIEEFLYTFEHQSFP